MSEKYVKLVAFLTKKPGMSFEAFKAYYETKHSKLIELVPRVERYLRRYLHRIDDLTLMTEGQDQDYHVITELWFKNRQDLDFAMRTIAEPSIMKIIAQDEEHLFDRAKARLSIVDECESDLTGIAAAAPARGIA